MALFWAACPFIGTNTLTFCASTLIYIIYMYVIESIQFNNSIDYLIFFCDSDIGNSGFGMNTRAPACAVVLHRPMMEHLLQGLILNITHYIIIIRFAKVTCYTFVVSIWILNAIWSWKISAVDFIYSTAVALNLFRRYHKITLHMIAIERLDTFRVDRLFTFWVLVSRFNSCIIKEAFHLFISKDYNWKIVWWIIEEGLS